MRPFVFSLSIGLASLGFAFSGTSFAQSRSISTTWDVQPTVAPTETQTVKQGEWVIKQTLLPKGLFRLESNVDLKDAPLLIAGAQFIEIDTEGPLVACDAVGRKQLLLGMRRNCLIDYEKDGAFDGVFAVESTSIGGGLPDYSGKFPKDAQIIPLARYTRISPTEILTPYFVGIRNAGKGSLYNRQNFQICYGSEASVDCVSNYNSMPASMFPASVQIMGANFTVLSGDKESVVLNVEAAMPPQPFRIFISRR